MRKIGILGGTFDPIHAGHLSIARTALREGGLDCVLLLPDGQPPHKSELTAAHARLNMTILAALGEEGLRPCELEVEREGTTYTIDTLRQLHEAYPEDRLCYVIGGDTLYQVPTWREATHLGELCDMIAVPRAGDRREELLTQAARLKETLNLEILLTEGYGPEISSTDVRERLKRGEEAEGMLPEAVRVYIAHHGLYGHAYSQMAAQLQKTLSEYRFRHTLSVAETALWLAFKHGVDPVQAHLAGMLHDCAKGMDAPTLLHLIKTGGVSADELELSMPALLHAPAGAVLARTQYHVNNPAVLSAIRWHTTGRRNMTPLEKVVYLADMIEPTRAYFPGLERIRALAPTDLTGAVRLAASLSAAYVAKRGKKLHPRTIELAKDQPKDDPSYE